MAARGAGGGAPDPAGEGVQGHERAPTQWLADIGGPGPPDDPVGSAMAIRPYDPAPAQERMRGSIAIALIVALALIVIFLLVIGAVLADDCFASAQSCTLAKSALELVMEVANLVFTPVVGLVGSVIGFYFGAKSAGR